MDYGVGNLHSVQRAFERAGARVEVRARPGPDAVGRAAFVVLPGVGSFTAGTRGLRGWRQPLRRAALGGKPVLGICLGMQLLFERSEEGPGRGLALLPGRVARLRHAKLPQIGWNDVRARGDPLFEGLPRPFDAYYVNSFTPVPEDRRSVIATSTYGGAFAAGVRRLNTYGLQFHPEKSSTAGLRIARNFLGIAEALA